MPPLQKEVLEKGFMPKAIVIGASSGIGRALAKKLAAEGYELGVTARRVEMLDSLQTEIGKKIEIRHMDLLQPKAAIVILEQLIRDLGALDLIIINSGVNHYSVQMEWPEDYQTATVNVTGFLAMANVAARYFKARKQGHLVGISSIAGTRGSGRAPVYCATKSFVSTYLEGLRHILAPLGIHITDIRPGLIDTEMMKKSNLKRGMVSAEVAADGIFTAIIHKKRVAYVPGWWVWIAALVWLVPDFVFSRLIRKSIKGKK